MVQYEHGARTHNQKFLNALHSRREKWSEKSVGARCTMIIKEENEGENEKTFINAFACSEETHWANGELPVIDTCLSAAARNLIDDVCKHDVVVAVLGRQLLPFSVVSDANVISSKWMRDALGVRHFSISE